jgi:hypothetical protein
MAEPLPTTYGPAGWINWTHNWRKEDGDFLQYRGILRYADDASRPANPQTGQAVYVQSTDTVSVWSGEWIPLLSSRLVRLVSSGTGATGTATFAHISASGAGLVFSNTKLRSSIDFVTSAGFQADTVSVFTAAGGGNRTAKLTTSPANLISDSPILAPSLTLNGAAGADVLTLSAGNLKVVGTAAFSSMVSAAGSMQATRFLCTAAQDTTANAAARKDYVDAQIAAGDGARVAVAGDTMTGPLYFTRGGDAPFIQFNPVVGSTRFGYIQGMPGYMNYAAELTTSVHRFFVANAEKLHVDNLGVDITGNLTASGTAAVNSYIYSGVQIRAGGNGGQVVLIDTTAGGNNCYMGFYGSGTTAAPTGNAGYVGFNGTTELRVSNALSTGLLRLLTTGAGDITFQTGAGGQINFSPNGVFQGMMLSNAFIWGKAAADLNNAGIEMYGAGSGAEGSIRTTTSAASIQNLYCRHIGSASTSGQMFAQFAYGATPIGSITQNGTTGVKFNETSDRRAKTIVSPILGAVARFKAFQPYRVTWNNDSDRGETDALIADEVMNIVPEAVDGQPDEVYSAEEAEAAGVAPGSPKHQMLDYSKTITLTIATLLEIIGRVEALESAA